MRVRIAVLLAISVVAISAVAFAQGKDPGRAPSTPSGGSTAHLLHIASMVVLNPGNETATVGCIFVDAGGSLILDRGERLVIGRGGTDECTSSPDAWALGRGWMIIRSDQPVLAYGWYQHGSNRDNLQRGKMDFYPVDCDHPEGVEFACMFAGSGELGPAIVRAVAVVGRAVVGPASWAPKPWAKAASPLTA
jgi:hypothetical protein